MRKPTWHITRFDAYVDGNGEWKIHLDGRHRVGRVRLSDRASESEILRALQSTHAVELPARGRLHFDWLSDSAFNLMDGDEPLYQVSKGTK